jgi:molybdenum cofactor guanylyltransferase
MYNDITGIILAGGKSKRMGINKSFLKIGSQTIIERTAGLMNSLFPRVILIANNREEYEFLDMEIYEDIHKNIGPLGGIHSGLTNSNTEKNFIISCDMPLVNKNVIEFIINYKTDKPVIITKADGFIQQLCGVYSKNILPNIETIIKAENKIEFENSRQEKRGCLVLKLVKDIDAEIIDIALEYDSYKEGLFFNMNKPEDYEFVKGRGDFEN